MLDAAASGLDLLTAPEDGGNAGANVGVECRYSSNEVHAASNLHVGDSIVRCDLLFDTVAFKAWD